MLKTNSNRRISSSILGACTAGLLLLGCTDAEPDDPVDPGLPGVTRIDHGDGTYSYELPPDVATPPTMKRGALTMRYDGQARFDAAPEPMGAGWVNLAKAARTPREQMLGSVTIDALGRRWVAESVDDAALADALAAYDREVVARFGPEPGPPPGAATPPPRAPRENDWTYWVPTAWNEVDCNGDGDDDTFLWDSDGRAESANPMNDRQDNAVYVIISGVGTCTGTMVDDEWVLTAAHCVSPSGTAVSPSAITACTLGNYQSGAQCIRADALTVNSGWTGGTVADEDFAVFHLSSAPGVGWTAISTASDATIMSFMNYNNGYPGRANSCASNARTPIVSGFSAKAQWWDQDDVTSISSGVIRTNIDVSTGHSGGPIFYRPTSTTYYLTGVMTGHYYNLYDGYFNGGPHGPTIRSWVVANTP